MRNDVEDLLICQCSSVEHIVLIRYDKEDTEVYFEIHLVCRGFFRRLWNGIKYIFGYKCRYGDFDEIIIRKDDVDKLQSVIDHLKENKNDN